MNQAKKNTASDSKNATGRVQSTDVKQAGRQAADKSSASAQRKPAK